MLAACQRLWGSRWEAVLCFEFSAAFIHSYSILLTRAHFKSDIFLRHSEVVLFFFRSQPVWCFGDWLCTGVGGEEQQGERPWQSRCFPNLWFHDTTGSHHILHDENWVAGAQVQFFPPMSYAHPPGGLIISFRPQRLDINIDWSVIHYTQINSCCKFLNFLCYYYCATCSYMKVTHLLGFLWVLVPAAWLALSVSFLQAAQMQQNTNKITLIFNTT